LLGPESKVAKREDLATVGVNSYMSPGMCATKKGVGDMYGSRQKLWDMSFLYQEIMDFATIFNVEDRGNALIADFKKRENNLRAEFSKNKKTSRLFSGSPVPPRLLTPMLVARTVRQDLSQMSLAAITPLPQKPNGQRLAGKASSPLTPMSSWSPVLTATAGHWITPKKNQIPEKRSGGKSA
jgi:hypothetical protein